MEPSSAERFDCMAFDEKTCDPTLCHPEYSWVTNDQSRTPATFGFVVCADGETASCTKPSNACDEPDPNCAAHGNYRVNWVGGCHEGCVRADDCAPE